MRAGVIGGSGQIGGWLLRELAGRGHDAAGTYATTAFPGLDRLDADDLDAAAGWLRALRPDVVFYPAGFTWVDGCERDPARARASNLEQPLSLARVAADLGARFVYFSTDYVFDGRRGPYAEEDPPRPLSVYGRAKLDAEVALAEALGDRLLTLRTTWVFGPERQGKNFAYQLARALHEGKPWVVPSDQRSTPTYGPDIARAAVVLAEQDASGLFHVAGPEFLDRLRFARILAESFGLDADRVEGKPTAEFGQPAARPLDGGLRTPRLDAVLPGAMRPLARALEDFKRRLEEPGGWSRALWP